MAALARALAPTTVTDGMFDDLAAELAARQAVEIDLSNRYPGPTDEEVDRLTAHSGEIAHRIINARATTLAGFKAKANAAVWATGGEDAWREFQRAEPGATYDQFVFSIVNDLVALPSATVHPFPHLAVVEPVETVSELRRAAADFMACQAQADEIAKRLDVASAAAEAMYPEVPALIRDPQRPGRWLDRITLAHMDESARKLTWPTPPGSPRVEAFEKWSELRQLIDGSFGVPGLDDAWEKARDATDKAADRVVALSPTTVQDAVVKYAVLLASYGDAKGGDITAPFPFFAFLKDLERLAASQ